MGLPEMQASAARYAASQTPEHIAEIQRQQRKEEELDEILQKFGVTDSLQTIRDVFWGEGTVSPGFSVNIFGSGPIPGIHLYSDEYPSIVLGGRYSDVLKVTDDRASIIVSVGIKKQHWGRGLVLDVSESPLSENGRFDRGSMLEQYKAARRIRSVPSRIIEPVQGGRSLETATFRVSEDSEVDRFNYWLLENARKRKENGNLPAQIRARSERVIAEFPAVLSETGRATRWQLRRANWRKPAPQERVTNRP